MRPRNDSEKVGGVPIEQLRGVPVAHVEELYSDDTLDQYSPHESYIFEDPSVVSVEPTTANTPNALVNWHGESSIVWPTDQGVGVAEPTLPKSVIETLNAFVPESTSRRIRLPIDDNEAEIRRAFRNSRVVIMQGEPGCGKSTRTPQMLLKTGLFSAIDLLQPRRAASYNVFGRILSELTLDYGEAEARRTVAYRHGGGREGPSDATIQVVTNMYEHLRKLATLDKAHRMTGYLALLDEAHEASDSMEYYAAYYKQVMLRNPEAQVGIMSATPNTEIWLDFFDELCPEGIPIINIPGRQHELKRDEAPESTVVDTVLERAEYILDTPGERTNTNGVLAFLPGKRHIRELLSALDSRMSKAMRQQSTLLPFHARLTPREQLAAFRYWPGVKIIGATNAAETSITFPDIYAVVDSGQAMKMQLDSRGIQGLVQQHVSQSEVIQRAGRAGRVEEGRATSTNLDPTFDFVSLDMRPEYPTPQIYNTDLARAALDLLVRAGLDLRELETPHRVELAPRIRAFETLSTLGAIASDSLKVTSHGEYMTKLPLRPSLARIVAESREYAEVTRACVAAMAAAVEVGGMPNHSFDAGKSWKNLTEEKSSDLLAQLDMFLAVMNLPDAEVAANDIDVNNVHSAKELLYKILRRTGLTEDFLQPPTDKEREDIKRCILSGFTGSIYKYDGNKLYKNVRDPDDVRVISNRSIVNSGAPFVVGNAYRVEFFKDGELVVKHVIDGVTIANTAALMAAAEDLTEWKFKEFALRGKGKFHEVRNLTLFGEGLGITQEYPAEPSKSLRDAIIAHALKHPGQFQGKLRDIKEQLEKLSNKSRGIQPITQTQYVAMISNVVPDDITDVAMVDIYLMGWMNENNITLDHYVSPEDRANIEADSPDLLDINGVTLKIKYQRGQPYVASYRAGDISKLPSDIRLADHREVQFIHRVDGDKRKARRVSISMLRTILEESLPAQD